AANNFVGTVNATGNNVTLVDGTGGVSLGNIAANGALAVSSTGGPLTNAAGSSISAAGAATLQASQNGQPASVTLNDGSYRFYGPVKVVGSLSLATVAQQTLGSAYSQILSVTASGPIAPAQLSQGGSVNVVAAIDFGNFASPNSGGSAGLSLGVGSGGTAVAITNLTLNSSVSSSLKPIISGSAEPGSILEVRVGGATYQTNTDSTGQWAVDTKTATPIAGSLDLGVEGPKNVTIVSTNAAGVTSTAAGVVTVDRTAPILPTLVTAEIHTVRPIIYGKAEVGSVVEVTLGGATYRVVVDGSGTWVVNTEVDQPISGALNLTRNVANVVKMVSTDAAGNTSASVTELHFN
ncbi:MAG: hypothetical protein RL519_1426, partial [Pseudomonadota bacterium]